MVVDKIKEHILAEENLRELVRLVNEEMDAASQEHQRRLDVAIEEIADVNRRLDRLHDAVETGNLKLDDLAPRVKDLKVRKDNLQARKWELEWQMKGRKPELADTGTVTRYVQDLRDVLSNSSLAKRRSFIKSFVREVKVTGDKALLNYTIPLLLRVVTAEEMPVLSNVHFGGPLWTRTTDPGLIRTVL